MLMMLLSRGSKGRDFYSTFAVTARAAGVLGSACYIEIKKNKLKNDCCKIGLDRLGGIKKRETRK